ncbi:MAG: autotransporter outer membrane beta-barrel domain-containing protein, partial [Pseudomonadota bacterium]
AGTVFASTTGAAQSSSTDVAYFFQGRGGWTFQTEVGRIEPYLHGATRNQSFGSFSETNASIFGLSVPSASLSEAEYGAGVRWACVPIKTVDQRVAVAPTIDLAYVRFTNDGPIQVETNLLGTSVVGQTAALGADAIRVAAGLSLTSLAGISGSFGYTGTVRDAATAHTVSGGLSIKF